MTEKKKEIWMPIKGYEGVYEVSNLGRVKTVRRKAKTSNRTVPEIIRKPNVMKGYHCVALRKDGTVKVYRIHRLVAETFIGSAPSEEYQINHIDGNKANNSVDNLEWVTPKENTHHAFESGLRPKILPESVKKKIGERSKQLWQSDDYRNVQSEKAKEVWSEPQRHAERATAIKEGIRRAKENGTYRKQETS